MREVFYTANAPYNVRRRNSSYQVNQIKLILLNKTNGAGGMVDLTVGVVLNLAGSVLINLGTVSAALNSVMDYLCHAPPVLLASSSDAHH